VRLRPALLVALAAAAALPAGARAADVPAGAAWTEATIPSSGGVQLHADILRPKNLAATAGFGGSTGCLDWGGPGEQSAVVSAVRWAATEPWSTGKVGMYGKSYDGVTGLIGVKKRPSGLAAVVSQEPVYDLYRYLYGDGMRRANAFLTPALYDLIDATPGPLADNPNYNVNGATEIQRRGCLAANYADQAANDDHYSAYWRERTLIPGAKGSDVPLLVTQGLTENNTVADGTARYLQNHTGYERAWLGPWEHVRGNERDETGRLKTGRAGWFDEVMRFYDRFLKGVDARNDDPQIAVQTNDGKWRGEQSWPPADATAYTTELRTGTYTDDGTRARPATAPRRAARCRCRSCPRRARPGRSRATRARSSPATSPRP
jgi:putative CocE/NonD family hydrolase